MNFVLNMIRRHQANEIKKGKLALLQKEKKEQALMGTLVIILLVVFALWYRYKRQNQLYTRIVCLASGSYSKRTAVKRSHYFTASTTGECFCIVSNE